uniref:Uncharacterized protein n=1 Tax=Setaria viridis TaxID=4556 RepID=A0A4V6D7J8_SETVI|nr:hypothetical protein SEVIR_7G169700v2 [Setaria viridis]
MDPSTVASRDSDFDVGLTRFDASRCASSSGPWEDRFPRSVPNGLVPLKPHNPVVSWADPFLVCPRRFTMNRAPLGSYIHDFVRT